MFKPVRWVKAGEADAAQARAAAQQPNGHNPGMPQPEEEEDPWALGEAKSARRPPAAPRRRLTWAVPPVDHHAQPHVQRPAQSVNNRVQPHSRRPPQQPIHKHNGAKHTVQKQAKDWWKQFQPPAQQDVRQSSAADYQQYLRNQAQMQRQAAEHEEKKRQMNAAQQPLQPSQPAYGDLKTVPKRKAAPPPQPAPEAPTEIEIPPDVTVRQLADLLGMWVLARLHACSRKSAQCPPWHENQHWQLNAFC